jgi:hypothetical protein
MSDPRLTDLEVVSLAVGMLVERYHVSPRDATEDLVWQAAYHGVVVAAMSRALIREAALDASGDESSWDIPEDDTPRLVRPADMPVDTTDRFAVALAVGVLFERYVLDISDALEMFNRRVLSSNRSEVMTAMMLVHNAASMTGPLEDPA